jgi:arsenical pump membrane protein
MAAWQLVIALLVLAVVVFFLLKPFIWKLPQALAFLPFESFPVRLSVPLCNKLSFHFLTTPISMQFDFSTVPILAVCFLLVTTTISPSDAWDAIRGTSALKPYAIIILFFALAYCSISLDSTGLFDFLAVKAVNASNGSGWRLFFAFFFLSSVITIATSNDIVILTLTPIIAAVTQHAKIDPMPLLYAQFFAANIWSMSLFIGNPTNIIVAQAQSIGFLQYSQWMIVPTIASGLTCLGMLYLLFKDKIPVHVDVPLMDPMQNFRDVPGAVRLVPRSRFPCR